MLGARANKRQPDFDLDKEIGAQSELWVHDIRELMAKKNGEIEVKAPKPFLEKESFYVEYECQSRKGEWYPSGIATTKAKAYFVTFGSLPGGLVVATDWLKKAARHAYKDKNKHRQCMRGSNPTHAVVVSLHDLWVTREHEP
jgi:hypothetical protein